MAHLTVFVDPPYRDPQANAYRAHPDQIGQQDELVILVFAQVSKAGHQYAAYNCEYEGSVGPSLPRLGLHFGQPARKNAHYAAFPRLSFPFPSLPLFASRSDAFTVLQESLVGHLVVDLTEDDAGDVRHVGAMGLLGEVL